MDYKSAIQEWWRNSETHELVEHQSYDEAGFEKNQFDEVYGKLISIFVFKSIHPNYKDEKINFRIYEGRITKRIVFVVFNKNNPIGNKVPVGPEYTDSTPLFDEIKNVACLQFKNPKKLRLYGFSTTIYDNGSTSVCYNFKIVTGNRERLSSHGVSNDHPLYFAILAFAKANNWRFEETQTYRKDGTRRQYNESQFKPYELSFDQPILPSNANEDEFQEFLRDWLVQTLNDND
jgi:hypothetical protein